MFASRFRRSLKARSKSLQRPWRRDIGHPQASIRPQIEHLEDRLLLYAGALDQSFGLHGMVQTPVAGGAYAVALQSDGKIVVAGTVLSARGDHDFLVARYNTDGNMDSTFGGGTGLVETDIARGSDDYASSVAIQNDGGIVVGGWTDSPGKPRSFALARYNTDGTLDTNFGAFLLGHVFIPGTGIITTQIAADGGNSQLNGIALQPDGKIVAAGWHAGGSNFYFALARYNSDGSLDASFAGSNVSSIVAGEVITDFRLGAFGFEPFAQANRVGIQADGRIIAVGVAGQRSGFRNFAIARYNSDGSPDADFNADGRVTTNLVFDEFLYSMAIQSDGKILAAGLGLPEVGPSISALLRYNPDGTLDTTFGSGGMITGVPDQGIALQADGKIVAAGTGNITGGTAFVLVRYNPDGTLDPSFSFDGKVATDFGSGVNALSGVTIQPDGKVVAAGYTDTGIAIARYDGDAGQLQFDVTASTVAETAATLSGPLPSSYIAGSPGAKHVTLTVTRIAGSTGSVSVNFATSDGTATAGADYLAQAGTLFFADGQTSQTIRIPILDDGTIEGGSETFNVTLSSPGGGAVLGSQTTQVVTIADPDLAVLPITSVEGASFSGQVATFAGSNPAVAAGDYAAAISWGDGTAVSSGTITPNGSGGFNVTASHTYAEEGSFPIAVTITGGDTISGTNTATVADASLTATGTKLNVTGTKKFSGTVATFTDADPGGTVGDYSATITWDDGTTSAGTVAGSGPFTVSGSHTFPTFSGLHRITIAISDAGGSSATVDDAVKDPTPNQHFVMQLYNDLLQRPADNDGLAAWTTLLDQGVSRRQVALDFEASREFHQELVQNLYSQLLGRAADAAGLAGWTQFLDQGGTSVELEALLLGSAEYFNNHGGSYGGWLDALYQDVLHRPADQPGAQAWIRDLAQGASRDAVALAILHSPEAEETTIDGWYRNYLRRRADPGGLQAFATDLELGMTPDQVLALILASDEYFSRG